MRKLSTKVVIDDQEIKIRIEEKSKLTSKTLTKGWGSYEYYTREYTPTEKLSLVIDNYCWGCGIRKAWRDGKIRKVEEKLGEFVSALLQHAEHKKQRELRREAEKLEKQMLEKLKKQSTDLKQSRELIAYIDEVKGLAKEQYKDSEYPVELRDWIIWAENYAVELNPLNKGLPIYQKATEIVKLEEIE